MAFWNQLSPFTRRLAVVVLLSCAAVIYTKARLKPLRAEVARQQRTEAGLHRDVAEARDRVERLRQEASSSQHWAAYALVLEQQSTGRSLHDILETCGTEGGPSLAVNNLRFDRMPAAGGFARMGASFTLRGPYPELIRLLHSLDEAFPPIEITRTSLSVSEDENARGGQVVAELEGVIYEPH